MLKFCYSARGSILPPKSIPIFPAQRHCSLVVAGFTTARHEDFNVALVLSARHSEMRIFFHTAGTTRSCPLPSAAPAFRFCLPVDYITELD